MTTKRRKTTRTPARAKRRLRPAAPKVRARSSDAGVIGYARVPRQRHRRGDLRPPDSNHRAQIAFRPRSAQFHGWASKVEPRTLSFTVARHCQLKPPNIAGARRHFGFVKPCVRSAIDTQRRLSHRPQKNSHTSPQTFGSGASGEADARFRHGRISLRVLS